MAIFVEFDMDSLLLFPTPQEKFRLVINQSVGSSGVESTPGDRSCLSVDSYLRVYLSFNYVRYIISIMN